jgi:hypothetical protein
MCHHHVIFVHHLDEGVRCFRLEKLIRLVGFPGHLDVFDILRVSKPCHLYQLRHNRFIFLHSKHELIRIDRKQLPFPADTPNRCGIIPLKNTIFKANKLTFLTQCNPNILSLRWLYYVKLFVYDLFLWPNHICHTLFIFALGVAMS